MQTIKLLGFKHYGEFYIEDKAGGYSGTLSIRTMPFQSISYEIASPVIEHIHLDVQTGKLKFGKFNDEERMRRPPITDEMNAFYTQFEHLWTCRVITNGSLVAAYLYANANVFCVEKSDNLVHQNVSDRNAFVFVSSGRLLHQSYSDWKQRNTVALGRHDTYLEFLHELRKGSVSVE